MGTEYLKIPLISTAHLTQEDMLYLMNYESAYVVYQCILEEQGYGLGIFLFVEEDYTPDEEYNSGSMYDPGPDKLSESFHKLMSWAVRNKMDFLRITNWGELIEDDSLDVNDW